MISCFHDLGVVLKHATDHPSDFWPDKGSYLCLNESCKLDFDVLMPCKTCWSPLMLFWCWLFSFTSFTVVDITVCSALCCFLFVSFCATIWVPWGWKQALFVQQAGQGPSRRVHQWARRAWGWRTWTRALRSWWWLLVGAVGQMRSM